MEAEGEAQHEDGIENESVSAHVYEAERVKVGVWVSWVVGCVEYDCHCLLVGIGMQHDVRRSDVVYHWVSRREVRQL